MSRERGRAKYERVPLTINMMHPGHVINDQTETLRAPPPADLQRKAVCVAGFASEISSKGETFSAIDLSRKSCREGNLCPS